MPGFTRVLPLSKAFFSNVAIRQLVNAAMLEARPCVAGLRGITRSDCWRAATHGAPSYITAFPHCHIAALVKQYPNGLVIQPCLHELRLGFLRIALQAEKAGRIAFIDAYFQVTC